MKPSTTKGNGHQPKKGNSLLLKKSTDIKWNSAIFFQVGLIIALLLSVFAMDMKIGEKQRETLDDYTLDLNKDYFDVFTIEEEPKKVEPKPVAKKQPRKVPTTKLIDKIKKIENNAPEPETKIDAPTAEPIPDTPVKKSPPAPEKPVKKTTNYANSVEFAPVYPGCESLNTNAERIQCLSDKISRFVGRKFNTGVADDNTFGEQRINVQFKIDKNGFVTDVKARAKDKNLEKEAQRIINKLPPMQPGMQGDVKVDVLYLLPIVFKIE